MSAFARVSFIAKTRNLEGSVVATSADGLPFLLCEGMEVHFVPPSLRGPRNARVSSIRQIREDSYEVSFEDVEGIDDAEKIVGCYCLANSDSIPEIDPSEDPRMLLGFSVQDEMLGALGPVTQVMLNPAQAILVVEGDRGEVMIPFVDEFVEGIDMEAEVLEVRVPAGLLSLNEEKEQAEDAR